MPVCSNKARTKFVSFLNHFLLIISPTCTIASANQLLSSEVQEDPAATKRKQMGPLIVVRDKDRGIFDEPISRGISDGSQAISPTCDHWWAQGLEISKVSTDLQGANPHYVQRVMRV
jgi:hypothetical protein